MSQPKVVALALDVGERRIGLALGDSIGRVALPLTTLQVDGSEVSLLQKTIAEHDVAELVVGLPRNQQGDETAQSAAVRQFVKAHVQPLGLPVKFQDESVSSVIAEQELRRRKKPLTKEMIDAQAAAIFLQDYLEAQYG